MPNFKVPEGMQPTRKDRETESSRSVSQRMRKVAPAVGSVKKRPPHKGEVLVSTYKYNGSR